MASSYRQDLNNGYMPEWEKALQEAIAKLQFVINEIYECNSDQIDNAIDDGMLAMKLSMAQKFIEEELPTKNENPKATT